MHQEASNSRSTGPGRAFADRDDDVGTAGSRALDELARLGVFYRLPKDRVNIPDIYQMKFRIDRKSQKGEAWSLTRGARNGEGSTSSLVRRRTRTCSA